LSLLHHPTPRIGLSVGLIRGLIERRKLRSQFRVVSRVPVPANDCFDFFRAGTTDFPVHKRHQRFVER
jgi:hypothetical protein